MREGEDALGAKSDNNKALGSRGYYCRALSHPYSSECVEGEFCELRV